MYRAAVHDGTDIKWCCVFYKHPDADSTMEDVSLPDPESIIVDLPPQENPLEDSDMGPDPPPQQPHVTTYHLVLEGTIRGKTKLVTNTGYTFNIRKRWPNGTNNWQCTVRWKDHWCKASAIQQDGVFFPGLHDHNHPSEFGVLTSTQIKARVTQVNIIDLTIYYTRL